MDEFDEKREKKVIKFFKNWDHNRKSQHEDDKYRWYSSENLWIASEDSTRDWWVMFETFLLRVYYLNDLDDIDCKTCLLMLMQSRDNDKMLQFRVQCSVYNHEHDALLRCMIAMMVQHEDGGLHARPRWCIWYNALPWCWPNDAYTMMQGWWYLQCMHVWNAWSMMHTLMSWWCMWLAPYNRSLVANTWIVLYP
jgi:hypothetical protein